MTESYQWAWNMGYCDPARHERELRSGFRGVPIAPGVFPPGYRIPNGRPGGGSASQSTSDGTLPIRIQPPVSGVGRLTFVTNFKLLAENRTMHTIELAAALGVTSVNGPNRPMFPYLGVSHDRDPYTDQLVHVEIKPGHIIQLTGFRLDIVDQAFAAVPDWPNWQMLPGTSTQLWPAISPTLRIRGGNVIIKGVYCHGFAC